jgi:hypothetical protein
MLKFMKKAGDDVHILTVDSKTPSAQLPKEYMGYTIEHTQGFTFPLYNHISLTIDLPEMKGGHILERMKPDIIHVTSPGFLLFAAMFYARVMKIPLVMSYHTHLPSYGTYFSLYYFFASTGRICGGFSSSLLLTDQELLCFVLSHSVVNAFSHFLSSFFLTHR